MKKFNTIDLLTQEQCIKKLEGDVIRKGLNLSGLPEIRNSLPSFTKKYQPQVHFGAVAYKRSIWKDVKHPDQRRGQDCNFIRAVNNKYAKIYAVNAPLILYIIERSTSPRKRFLST